MIVTALCSHSAASDLPAVARNAARANSRQLQHPIQTIQSSASRMKE